MITKTKQDWTIGKAVKVGFLTLTVVDAKETKGDGLPDKYLLKSSKGVYYRFVPHNGIEKLFNKEEF